jgi:two-component sensor histidine kinase/tetratricopeptide (TPR) repeat protein
LLFLLSMSFSGFAQQSPETVRRGLRTATVSSNPDSLGYHFAWLGYYQMTQQHYDSAKYFYLKAFKYTEITGNKIFSADNLSNLGLIYMKIGNFDSSSYFLNSAYKRFADLKDTAKSTILEINLGYLYSDRGLYEQSLKYLLAATYTLEKQQPAENLASCYNNIGNIYTKMGEPYIALTYLKKALDVRRKLDLQQGISGALNNIGNVYLSLKQYDSALNNFQKCMTIKRALNDKSGEAICLNNMGELKIQTGDLEEAEELLKQALSIRITINEKAAQVSTRNNLAHVSLLRGNLPQAKRELKYAEERASSLGLLEQLKTNYELQVRLYRVEKNFDNALKYSDQLLLVKDSILNQEKAKSLAEMRTRYESLKKEDRIKLLEKEGLLQLVELERRQVWIRSLWLAVGLTLIIGLLIYYNLRTTRKNKIHIELLLKELHHRVKNNLQILSSLLSLQSQQLTDDSAIKAVKSSESRINAMALIHRKLYTVDQNRTVDIKEYITELIQYLVYSYGYHERNFKLDLDINEINIDVDKAIPLGLILNELISNAFKHAYENQPNPTLAVNLFHPGAHELNIRITDNGPGMRSPDEKQRKTFGMKIVTTLIKELKGSLNVKCENGTTYELHIPI